MNNTFNKPGRIHSLDALRATMMMLGIVLHSTETYSVGIDLGWPRDPNSSHILMNYLNSLIHLFRMPLFFLMAGFFGALLFYQRSPLAMLQNRFKRIILPFIAFLILFHPLLIRIIRNTVNTFQTEIDPVLVTPSLVPQITYHLWFLYYLILISAFTFVLAKILRRRPGLSQKVKWAFEWLMTHRTFFVLIFSVIIFALLVWMWNYWASTPLGFIPDLKIFIFYTLFYLMGWLLFCSKHLLQHFTKNDWLLVCLGLFIFTLKYIYIDEIGDIAYGALNAIIIWFFVFGITGLFVRYGSNYSSRGRYISDSSYWVYLVHLPLTIWIPSLISDWPLPALIKFLIVAGVTTFICFLSYHFLVRSSFIGMFLNGKKLTMKRTT